MHVREPTPECRYGYREPSVRWNVSRLQKRDARSLRTLSPKLAAKMHPKQHSGNLSIFYPFFEQLLQRVIDIVFFLLTRIYICIYMRD